MSVTTTTRMSNGAANAVAAPQMAEFRKWLRTEGVADDQIRDRVRIVNGPQPYLHNHFHDERFFLRDRARGTVKNVYGQRILYVTEEFVTGLMAGLEQEVGDAAGEIMYRCGYHWGLQDMKSFTARAQAEYEVQFNKLWMGMMLESWWWPLQIEGWGTWRYDFRQGKQGLIFIDLFESAVAKSIGDVGKVMCYFYAGLFAAVFTVLSKRELSCIEIQCYSMGEDHCKFLVATNKRVNAAAFWRNEGATSKDIMTRVSEVS